MSKRSGPISYVAGFLFRDNGHNPGQDVALIQKLRPAWQKGKLNGIGGKIEEGEQPMDAMRREFREEAGVLIPDWRPFSHLTLGDGGRVFFFKADATFSLGDYVIRSMTAEQVGWYSVKAILNGVYPVVPNLRWLLPLAQENTLHGAIYGCVKN